MKILSLVSMLLMCLCNASQAASFITVTDAWVREAPPGAAMLAAYMKISNNGSSTRVLSNVESPQFNHVMLHRSFIVDGVARMTHEDNLPILPNRILVLEPGNYHLMMPVPDTPPTAGDCVEFVLTMQNGERIKTFATVKRAGYDD